MTTSIASGKPFEPVDAPDEHVADAALAEVVQDREPELGALGPLEPEAQDVAFAVEVDADREVAGEVADGALHDQRVQKQDR
jgi:hypothetical protein